MKRLNRKPLLHALLLASSFVASSSFAISIPNYIPLPEGTQFATTAAFNHNVAALQALTPQALEQQLNPFMAHRLQVTLVEPVLKDGQPDVTASGIALEKAINAAGEKNVPVEIFVDAGNYTITQTLVIPANVSLQGETQVASHIKALSIQDNGAGLSNLTLDAQQLSIASTTTLNHVQYTGTLAIDGGNVTLRDSAIVNDGTLPTVVVGDAKTIQFDNVTISAPKGIAVQVNSAAVTGTIKNSTLTGTKAIVVSENAALLLVNNKLSGALQLNGTATTSKQHCHANYDATGLPVPNYASGVSNLCQAPSGGQAA